MSGYQRINFKDQNVERPKTYDVTNNPDGSITLIESFGNVEELGTPINQENMNHIEDGIDAVSFSKFSLDSTYKKDDLVTDIQDDELKIFKSLKDNNFGHLPSESDYWEEVEIAGGNGSGFNLGDMIITDHILEGNDAKGKALQGTYVSKALYPDFYNKWYDYFKNANQKAWLKSNVSKAGSVVDNQGVLSNFSNTSYAYVSDIPTDIQSLEMVFAFTTAADVAVRQTVCGQLNTNKQAPQIAILADTAALQVIVGDASSNWVTVSDTYVVQPNTNYQIKLTWDGAKATSYIAENGGEFTQIGEPVATTTCLFADNLTIGLDQPSSLPLYPWNGSIDLKDSYININGTRFWTGANSIAKNPNGLRFYNIAEKSLIDDIYEQYGIADFYGIDEENERVFLPRNKYFQQLTDDVSKVNEMVEAGLPNITGQLGQPRGASGYPNGAFQHLSTGAAVVAGGNGNISIADFDASRSSSIYGNSDTVQPPSSLKLLYYCVGNTVVNEAQIDAGGLVAQVEQKANTTLDNVTPEAKTIMANMPMPSDNYIDLTLGANGTDYTAPANGYFYFAKTALQNQTVGLIRRNIATTWKDLTSYQIAYTGSGNVLPVWLPVKKGDKVEVNYNATGATQSFKFFYAEGEQ